MPLQDHFHPPLSIRRHWHAFHNAWATYLASDLNRHLPEGYFAEPNVQFGIEIDVATFEEHRTLTHSDIFATLPGEPQQGWAPSAPVQTIDFPLLTDSVEVLVYNQGAGPNLAGAIELVSPANKDRPENRDAFLSKCQTYLQHGIGLVIVDVVTERRTNLHNELLLRFPAAAPLDAELYAVAYRTVKRGDKTKLDMWPESLAIGKLLPTMPLWLRGGHSLPVELEMTYERTCQEQRLRLNGS